MVRFFTVHHLYRIQTVSKLAEPLLTVIKIYKASTCFFFIVFLLSAHILESREYSSVNPNCIYDHIAEYLSCCCGGSEVDKRKDRSMSASLTLVHFIKTGWMTLKIKTNDICKVIC